MSAVIEETKKDTGLAVVEPKSLNEILSISDECPADFYKNPAYLEQVKTVKKLAGTLVHNIDEQGRADSKKDAAAIRKFAKTTNSFTLNIFRSMSDGVKKWRDNFTKETKELEAIADGIDEKFKRMEQEKLDSIAALLAEELIESRNKLVIKAEFWGSPDLKPMIKLTTLTGTGNLTNKAKEFIKAIADGELVQQTKIESRHLLLENRCLRAEINPPLTQVHFGTVFYADEELFNEKMEELIALEVERKAELVAKIEKQNKEANEKKIADALEAQQEEANRKAKSEQEEHNKQGREIIKETAVTRDAELNPPRTPEQLRETADSIAQSAQYADRNEDRNRELSGAERLRQQADEIERQKGQAKTQVERIYEPPVDDKKTVTVTAQFQIRVRKHISAEAVANHFKTKLPDELAVALINCEGQEHG
jgi:hypothetical protein